MLIPKMITEDHIDLMHIIEQDPSTSQREIAQNAGLSIGKVNYCIKTLISIGFMKLVRFKNLDQKNEYLYILTPKGIEEKKRITKNFITKKKLEYEKFKSYINE